MNQSLSVSVSDKDALVDKQCDVNASWEANGYVGVRSIGLRKEGWKIYSSLAASKASRMK